jgi:Heliorhodopsin
MNADRDEVDLRPFIYLILSLVAKSALAWQVYAGG